MKILIPEKTNEIIEAIKFLELGGYDVYNEIQLPKDWFERVTNSFNTKQKEILEKTKLDISQNNLVFQAFSAVYLNIYDGLLIGHSITSKEVFLYTILFYGMDNFLSSAFICKDSLLNKVSIWTDCAFNINPSEEQLALIANNALEFSKNILEDKASVSFLSYATHNSAGGISVEKVKKAQEIFKNNFPKIYSDGPLQFDTAYNPKSYSKKLNKKLDQEFSIYVFPNLDAGNISYKVASQLGKQEFYGPFVLGANKIICDLSRSATTKEIIETIKYMEKI